MIHNLVQCLNSPEDLDSVIAEQDARTYGRIRWRQGCRLNEFLREFARMRMLLLDEAFVFEGLALDFNDQAKQALRERHVFPAALSGSRFAARTLRTAT